MDAQVLNQVSIPSDLVVLSVHAVTPLRRGFYLRCLLVLALKRTPQRHRVFFQVL